MESARMNGLGYMSTVMSHDIKHLLFSLVRRRTLCLSQWVFFPLTFYCLTFYLILRVMETATRFEI